MLEDLDVVIISGAADSTECLISTKRVAETGSPGLSESIKKNKIAIEIGRKAGRTEESFFVGWYRARHARDYLSAVNDAVWPCSLSRIVWGYGEDR